MNTFSLSKDQIEHYRTEGYVVVESVFDKEDLSATDAAIHELTLRALADGGDNTILELEPELVEGQPVPRRIFSPFDQHETFRSLATDPRMLDRIESLIGENFNLQHSKLNMKPAGVGSPVEWHQDLAYFPHTNDDLISTLVYLDDATEENGCLQVLPRHHHHFFDHTTSDGTFAGMITEDLSDHRFGRPIPLSAPAGSVIFMHCVLPHSSLPNRSSRSRRTLILEYRAADAYPLYFGPMTRVTEQMTRPIRGKPAQFARLGHLAPFIPTIRDEYKSLYELQQRTKAKQ